MKKNYNPLKMSLPYIFGVLIVVLAVLSFYSNMIILSNFLDKISINELFKFVKLIDSNSLSIGLFNPLAMLNLFIYGFLLGWLIQGIGRKLK